MQSIQSEPEMGFMEFINDLHEHMSEGDTVKIQSLINEIAKYDVFDFIARISSLNLLIENQNKSILFDALIAGLLTNDRAMYTGTIKMSSGKFRNIIGRLEDLTYFIIKGSTLLFIPILQKKRLGLFNTILKQPLSGQIGALL